MGVFDLSGSTALVTGAGRGIGRSIALGLAEAGSNVALCSRTRSELEEVANGVRAFGVEALIVPCDVTDPTAIQQAVDATVAMFTRIDVLVNNAGLTVKKPAEDYTLEDWSRILDVNLTGVFLFAQAVGRQMIRQGGGRIINISSIASETAITGSVAYCASKGGVKMVTRVLAAEWARHGIRVNAIAPAYTQTPLVKALTEAREGFADAVCQRTPMNRLGRPEEMVGAAVYLASDASSYVTGETLMVDGGWTSFGF
ncbi:glucose 1-dehydrogenase [Aquisalimonas sp.]|uniref:SDR family NAD(P)-dependent oxidoreductase n=1 Tax=Aquisalimonas sp. TaxID=1872621 RepID=UPI0025B8ABB2|nr:glucose 1-dehydrogenase [Aquisalimonas sp.]